MPKQIWIHKQKRTFVIRHSNADVVLESGEYVGYIPVAPFVTIESVGTDGLTAIHHDIFFRDYERVAIQQNDTIDDFIKSGDKYEHKRENISN